MSKCRGCGATLQTTDAHEIGYAKSSTCDFCERCFRIKHYNDYQQVEQSGEEFLSMVKDLGKTNHLIVLVVDLFSIPQALNQFVELFSNPILLVLTKRDLLPRDVYEERLKKYFSYLSGTIVDTVLVSAVKNYHMDELWQKIRIHQTDSKVYVVGYTNAGKSSLVNRLFANYTDQIPEITTSMLPSTTLENIEVTFSEDLVLIDTPGILDSGNILDILTKEDIKKVVPKQSIRPISYQIKGQQSIFIDCFVQIDCQKENQYVFYFANQLDIHRKRKQSPGSLSSCRHISVSDKEDVVMKGLGFFKVMHADDIDIYIDDRVEVYTRKSFL